MYRMYKFIHEKKINPLYPLSLRIKHPARPANKMNIKSLLIQPISKLQSHLLSPAKVEAGYYDSDVFFQIFTHDPCYSRPAWSILHNRISFYGRTSNSLSGIVVLTSIFE